MEWKLDFEWKEEEDKHLVQRVWKNRFFLVLLHLECNHGDDKEEGDPGDGGDEAHVDLRLHETPAARQDRAEC